MEEGGGGGGGVGGMLGKRRPATEIYIRASYSRVCEFVISFVAGACRVVVRGQDKLCARCAG